jgi:hypothetical protein
MSEIHGQKLLDELKQLKEAGVSLADIQMCALSLRPLRSAAPSVAVLRIGELADDKFRAQPALAKVLKDWVRTLSSEQAVPELCSHFERLALAASVLAAIRSGVARWPREVANRGRK